MRKRVFFAALVMLALLSGFTTPAVAVPDRATADRDFVLYIATTDPQSIVRAVAWSALNSPAQEAAVARFLDSEFAYARQLAAQTAQMDLDFIRRVLMTYTAEYAPAVHTAAQRVVNGSPDDRRQFVTTGFAAAEQGDRLAREHSGEQARALVEADRAYVRALKTDDPGPQVRVSAAWAVRAGSTDADLVEFFAYGWATGARLDLEAHRRQVTDREIDWRLAIQRLITEAKAAEQAARDAAEEAAEQAKAAAARAWRAVGDQTTPPRTAWSEAQQLATAQAARWQAIAEHALAAAGPNWQAVADPATACQSEWTAERQRAIEQAEFWASLLTEAQEGERRMGAPR
ncbi:hypothetical protein [Amycolatopsis nigrescens]|uniref:hypothetical protein n=1 Tax=Amycolatopsis nigrescens TaxID=381445 RepID=UPI0003A0EF2A|nr:hypothetical protein [Amycolatopsis nigrescens]